MNLAPLPKMAFLGNNGRPLVGGRLFTYLAGTNTKTPTYSDEAGTPNTNPVVLDFRGEANVWLDPEVTYKFVLAVRGNDDPPTDPIWSVDDISASLTIADLTRQFIGRILFPQTVAEAGAAITPTNYYVMPPDWSPLERYGSIPTPGLTDVWPMVTSIAAQSSTAVIRFPWLPNTSNVYYLGTFTVSLLVGRTIDVDQGVVLSIPSNEIVADGNAHLVKFARPTQFYFRTLNDYYTVGTGGNQPPVAKSLWIDPTQYDFGYLRAVLCNTSEIVALKINWDASDTWNSDVFAATSTKGFQIDFTADGDWHVGMRSVLPGNVLKAVASQPSGTAQLVAIVRHTDGYAGLYASPDGAATTLQFINKVTGVTGTLTDISFSPMRPTFQSYAGINSVWSITIDGWRNFSIQYNGVTVLRSAVTGDIFQAGFGSFGDGTASIGWNDIVLARRAPSYAGQFIAVKIFGDSTSQPRYDNWAAYLKEAFEFSGAVRNWKIINEAVGGADSAAQLTVMTNVGVADADVVVIGVGTNDVQGFVGAPTYLSNITAMLGLCTGKIVVFLDFGLWYGQAQAGARGQAATNYDGGAQYRSALLRLCAENGVKLVDIPSIEGPIVANYVNNALSPDMTTAGDTTVYDNIHPTTTLNRQVAQSITKAILGVIFQPVTFCKPSTALTDVQNGWDISIQAPFYQVSESGVVTIDGIVNDPGGATHTDGTTILILPQNIWPSRNKRFRAVTQATADYGLIFVSTAGEVQIFGVATATYVSLDALVWDINNEPSYGP